ncbi:hypothetical protein [Acanthopleuribacter pedis]|uniref:Uncharacterized protein n=1 Tax=Acanthopleuribacter pedis TaxID=442870 RepID=A0A8J7QPY2_9BACT|nr:hypothetical protein [Acanthopleuribacter pedis]MBO1321985.1 hypothetical protein [Acanthopleuribacter pedis]
MVNFEMKNIQAALRGENGYILEFGDLSSSELDDIILLFVIKSPWAIGKSYLQTSGCKMEKFLNETGEFMPGQEGVATLFDNLGKFELKLDINLLGQIEVHLDFTPKLGPDDRFECSFTSYLPDLEVFTNGLKRARGLF